MAQSKDWIKAARPHTLPLAIAGSLLGISLAYHQLHGVNYLIAALTVFTSMLLQILSNIANDFGDAINGADNADRVGPLRMTQSGAITKTEMKKGMILLSVLSFLSGVSLLITSVYLDKISAIAAGGFLLAGIIAILAAIAYTATDKPYGYMGLGDVSVFLFFGLLSVGGAFFMQAGILPFRILLPTIAFGLLCAGVLNVNNIRDIETDKPAGKFTIPVRLGREKATYYHWMLMVIATLFILQYSWFEFHNIHMLLHCIPVILFVINGFQVWKSKTSAEAAPLLKRLVLSILFFTIVFSIGLIVES
ncbi:MAG: 1,4-dihydroxy-2-naphthoate octaprenyltransferase [Bacteroidetes bacterium]|nr:1,4-dihydroxy-2-naphthoate octaprenyltransferase [Bacteroidota bacterium]